MNLMIKRTVSASNAATSHKPSDTEPVVSLITPITYGAPNPARLATELISAMPAAAADPARNWFGICQNTGIALIVPTIASVSAIKARYGTFGTRKPRAPTATAPVSAARPQWKRDSTWRSELRPLRIMPAPPKRYATAMIQPTVAGLVN